MHHLYHALMQYQTLGFAVLALIIVICVVWLLHDLFTDKGRHVKPRREAKAEARELAELMQNKPDYDGRTYPAPKNGYDPSEYGEEPDE